MIFHSMANKSFKTFDIQSNFYFELFLIQITRMALFSGEGYFVVVDIATVYVFVVVEIVVLVVAVVFAVVGILFDTVHLGAVCPFPTSISLYRLFYNLVLKSIQFIEGRQKKFLVGTKWTKNFGRS